MTTTSKINSFSDLLNRSDFSDLTVDQISKYSWGQAILEENRLNVIEIFNKAELEQRYVFLENLKNRISQTPTNEKEILEVIYSDFFRRLYPVSEIEAKSEQTQKLTDNANKAAKKQKIAELSDAELLFRNILSGSFFKENQQIDTIQLNELKSIFLSSSYFTQKKFLEILEKQCSDVTNGTSPFQNLYLQLSEIMDYLDLSVDSRWGFVQELGLVPVRDDLLGMKTIWERFTSLLDRIIAAIQGRSPYAHLLNELTKFIDDNAQKIVENGETKKFVEALQRLQKSLPETDLQSIANLIGELREKQKSQFYRPFIGEALGSALTAETLRRNNSYGPAHS